MAESGREAIIDYEFLRRRHNETVVEELCVATAAASETFRFKPTYKMADHGLSENRINWIDGHIDYRELQTVLNQAVAVFAHFYAHGVSKWTFVGSLTRRQIHNLMDINCPLPDSFNHERLCTLPCHRFPKFSYATKTAHSLYDWLMYYLQTKISSNALPT